MLVLALMTFMSINIVSAFPDQSLYSEYTEYSELISEPPSEEERKMIDFIIESCPTANVSNVDPYDVLALLRLEDAMGLPDSVRYMIPSVFCTESSLQKASDLRGDHGRALGPAQFHLPAYTTCITTQWRGYKGSTKVNNVDWRTDYIFSARCWVKNILRVMPRIEKQCPDLSEYDKWKVAEANVANWVRYKRYKCEAKSKHFDLLEAWKVKLVAQAEPMCL
jgi:hypothetical protein